MSVAKGAASILGTTSGIANLATSLSNLLGGGASTYLEQLRPASYRSFPFIALGSEGRFGRRNARHEYPLRDTPWLEDLGRAARRFKVTGFLIGDDVIAQRDILIQLLEIEDSGELVHPTYGRRTVGLLDFSVIERWDKGRYFELQFDFMESGARMFPSAANSTSNIVASALAALGLSAAAAFVARSLAVIAMGAAVVGMAVSTALTWYTTAKDIVGDARNLVSLVFSLPGEFGRFAGSATVPSFSKYQGTSLQPPATSVSELIQRATVSRAAVSTSAATLASAASSLDASSASVFAGASQQLAMTVLAATADPADGMRLLGQLANFFPAAATTQSPIGAAMATMQSACGDLFRRAALAALAQASSMYQPTSADDAAQVRSNVIAPIDAEILIAGDQGEDQTYESLRVLRSAVVQDLNTRGAGLPAITTVSVKAALPALVLANRLYRDAGRADELVSQGNPIHPAFMPSSFKALSS